MNIKAIGQLVKTNPIQTQSNPILSAVGGFPKAKIACQKIRPHLYFLRNHLLLVLGGDFGYIIKLGFIREIKTMSERAEIELFDNPRPERDYCITIKCPEFTSLCPRTSQPDFGEIVIEYCPDKLCIELKSLKFYLHSYRNKGIFYEALTNDILDDLKGVCKPRWMKITSRFTPRGGITTEVVAEYKAEK